MKCTATLALALIASCCTSGANAAEIILIAPGGIRAAVEQMIPLFEKRTGHTVKPAFGPSNSMTVRVMNGDAVDLPILQPPYPGVLASGHVMASSETPLAQVAVGVAVRPGVPHPDISTAAGVKNLLLSAKSLAYPDPKRGSAAGISFEETLKKLGVTDQMQPKIKLTQGGAAAMALLAKGEVDIALTFVSEILTEPGVELVGPLPVSISTPTRFSGFVGTHSKVPAAVKELLIYLSSAEVAQVYRDRGMVPSR